MWCFDHRTQLTLEDFDVWAITQSSSKEINKCFCRRKLTFTSAKFENFCRSTVGNDGTYVPFHNFLRPQGCYDKLLFKQSAKEESLYLNLQDRRVKFEICICDCDCLSKLFLSIKLITIKWLRNSIILPSYFLSRLLVDCQVSIKNTACSWHT